MRTYGFGKNLFKKTFWLAGVALASAACLAPSATLADAVTQIIQRDLTTLGYAPGDADGETTAETVAAISKFQAEHGLEVTGEATPQLAGVIKATLKKGAPPTAPTAAAQPVAPVPSAASQPPSAEALRAAQQACLTEKAAKAQKSQQRKRGFARLASAVTRSAARLGGDEISSGIAQLSADVYTAGAVADDFKGAAEDFGLTESDIDACRNPS
jgi:peptidoglycan hydrolase-like protein with peptidoglycan-binding domain